MAEVKKTFSAVPMPLEEYFIRRRSGMDVVEVPQKQARQLDKWLLGKLEKTDRMTLARLVNRVYADSLERSGEAFQFDEVSDDELREIIYKNIIWVRPGAMGQGS